MKRLAFLLSAAILGVSLCSGALAATLSGYVYFHDEEPAPCTDVMAYVPNEGCGVEDLMYWTTTDSCGFYEIPNLTAGQYYDIKVVFDTDRYCATAGWTGDCPDEEIVCEPVYIEPLLPVTTKNWDLELDGCDNTDCN